VLVFVVSLVGLGLQTAVAALCVELLRLSPFVAKITAIGVTFFWNYWVRRRFIFGTAPVDDAPGDVSKVH
jgi:putative flippase GtrA